MIANTKTGSTLVLFAAALFGGTVLVAAPASAQRYAPQEVDRSNTTCTRIAAICKQQQSAANCEGLRQECLRTGTWQGAREISRNVQRQ